MQASLRANLFVSFEGGVVASLLARIITLHCAYPEENKDSDSDWDVETPEIIEYMGS